jgi:hypothetical protein
MRKFPAQRSREFFWPEQGILWAEQGISINHYGDRIAIRRMSMAEDFEGFLLGGYCYSLRNAGPFTIGEDFEAPGPAGRILPRIKIGQNTWDKLWSFIEKGADNYAIESSEAEIFNDVMRRTEFENGVREALSWYVSDCQFQAELPTFRKQVKDLRKAIEQFQVTIPDDVSPLGHFLSTTYTGEVFLRDQRKPSRRELTALQGRWRENVGFPAIQSTLNTMLRNIEAVELLIGNKKPRNHQVKGLVQTLAKVWKKATETWPKSSRDPATYKQSGRFADFVRATNEILPKTFRIATLDAAIRAACEAIETRIL